MRQLLHAHPDCARWPLGGCRSQGHGRVYSRFHLLLSGGTRVRWGGSLAVHPTLHAWGWGGHPRRHPCPRHGCSTERSDVAAALRGRSTEGCESQGHFHWRGMQLRQTTMLHHPSMVVKVPDRLRSPNILHYITTPWESKAIDLTVSEITKHPTLNYHSKVGQSHSSASKEVLPQATPHSNSSTRSVFKQQHLEFSTLHPRPHDR